MKRFTWIALFAVAVVIASGVLGARADLLVSSYNNSNILRYDQDTGDFISYFVPPGSGGLTNPLRAIFGPDGYLYVTSGGLAGTTENSSVLRYDGTTGEFMRVFVSPGAGGLAGPSALAFGPDGNLYVSSSNSDQVLRYDGTTGQFMDEFAVGGPLGAPTDLVFGLDGNLYVSSAKNNAVLRYDGATGQFMDVFATGGPLNVPAGIVFGPDRNLYVSSQVTNSILRYDGMTGAFMDEFVPAGSGGLAVPSDLRFDMDGNLIVASAGSNAVLRYDGTTGEFIDEFISSQSVLNGELSGPTGLLYMFTQGAP